jgi:hypothetical protein
MAKYNLSHLSYQYSNLPAVFVFGLLLIGIYRTAIVAKWQLLNHAVHLYVYNKSNIYSYS